MERKIISESMIGVSQETIINRENQIHLFVDAIQYFKENSDKYINYIIELRNQYIDNLKNILNTFREFERNSDNIIYKIYFEKLNENFNKSKLNEFILTIQQPMPNIDYKVSTIKINNEILLKKVTPCWHNKHVTFEFTLLKGQINNISILWNKHEIKYP